MRYLVTQNYRTAAIAWSAGQAVELTPEAALAVNRDSPGTLVLIMNAPPIVEVAAAQAVTPVTPRRRDKMLRKGNTTQK